MQLLHMYHFTHGQACYSIFDDSGVNEDEIWINRDWFDTTKKMIILVMVEKLHIGHHQTTLNNG